MKIKDILFTIIALGYIAVAITYGGKDRTGITDTRLESYEQVTLAGGCFWCIESAFQEEPGIIDAVSGYTGGQSQNAQYIDVAAGTTQHREVVQVSYDSEIISFEEILNIFWSRIDPTDDGGQFADRGYQYTTAIYYHSDSQRIIANRSKEHLTESGLFETEIVTEIVPAETFYLAEEYHQDYYKKASEHYKLYEQASGRAGFVEETWARDAALKFFEESLEVQVVTPRGDYNYTDAEIEILLENLDPLAYHVVAENGTEQPFNNLYWDHKEDGIYVDVVQVRPCFLRHINMI